MPQLSDPTRPPATPFPGPSIVPPPFPPPAAPPSAVEPSFWVRLARRWGLLLVTGFGAGYVALSLAESWLSTSLIIAPVKREARDYGLEHFGVWTYGYAAGVAVLLLLVLAAVVLPQRIGATLAIAALVLTVPLALDLVVLAFKLGAARAVSGAAGAKLLASVGDDRHQVWFFVSMPAAHHAGFALLLLAVVAMQIPRPDLAPHLLAAVGVGAGLLSLALPWVTAYLPVAGNLVVERYWIWSVNSGGVLLGLGMLALAGMAVLGLVTRRVPLLLMLGMVVLGNLLLWGPTLLDGARVVEDQLKPQHPMSVEPGGAVRFLEFAALFLIIAPIRIWWRGTSRLRRPAEPPQIVAGSPSWPTAP